MVRLLGGLAFEGLNNAQIDDTNLIVIFKARTLDYKEKKIMITSNWILTYGTCIDETNG